jgi:protein TonB
LAITARHLAITDTENSPEFDVFSLKAVEPLALPRPPLRWSVRTRRAALVAAVLLHAAVIAFFLFWRPKAPPEEPPPADIAVVFDNGGQKQASAPRAVQRGPDTPAQAPRPAAAPPPPQQTVQAQPEVHLNMPDMPLADLQSAPEVQIPPAPQAQPVPRPQPRPVQKPPPPQKYIVMNGMSYGTPASPSPPMPNGMNMSLPQSDAQAVMGSDMSVQGDVGADYMAELHRWVEQHGYYPNAAIAQGQQGNAVVQFTVDRAGNVSGVHLLQSSGSNFIDLAWFQLFAQNQLPPFPPGTKADHITVEYTGEFQLIR